MDFEIDVDAAAACSIVSRQPRTGSLHSMKITVLTHLEKERDDKSYDVVVDQVTDALRALGHDASVFGVHAALEKMICGLEERRPDLVFNLMETFGKTHLGAVGAV